MPGPPPTPNVLKLLRGNPGKRRVGPEPEPQQAPDIPAAPDWLNGYACDEWHRVAPELHRLRLLTVVDIQPLAAYCQAYKRWRTAEEALALMAAKDPITHGLLVKRASGDAGINQLVKISRAAADSMIEFAGHFGRARKRPGVACQPIERSAQDAASALNFNATPLMQ